MVTVDLVQAALMFVLTNGRWLNFMLSWGEWLAIVDLLATHVYVRSAVYEFNAHMLNEILVTEEVVPKKIGVLLHDIALEKRDTSGQSTVFTPRSEKAVYTDFVQLVSGGGARKYLLGGPKMLREARIYGVWGQRSRFSFC